MALDTTIEAPPTEDRIGANAEGPHPGDVIVTNNLWKTYEMGDQLVHALRGVDIRIRHNEYVAIMGPSGSGKSTLLDSLAGKKKEEEEEEASLPAEWCCS